MAFINEKTHRTDSAKMNWMQFHDSQQTVTRNIFSSFPPRWTVDWGRSLFFWDIERPSPEVQCYKFCLVMKEHYITFYATKQLKEYPKSDDKLLDVFWHIFDISIPRALAKEKLIVLSLINEAFQVYGAFHGVTGPCGDVVVTINQSELDDMKI